MKERRLNVTRDIRKVPGARILLHGKSVLRLGTAHSSSSTATALVTFKMPPPAHGDLLSTELLL